MVGAMVTRGRAARAGFSRGRSRRRSRPPPAQGRRHPVRLLSPPPCTAAPALQTRAEGEAQVRPNVGRVRGGMQKGCMYSRSGSRDVQCEQPGRQKRVQERAGGRAAGRAALLALAWSEAARQAGGVAAGRAPATLAQRVGTGVNRCCRGSCGAGDRTRDLSSRAGQQCRGRRVGGAGARWAGAHSPCSRTRHSMASMVSDLGLCSGGGGHRGGSDGQ